MAKRIRATNIKNIIQNRDSSSIEWMAEIGFIEKIVHSFYNKHYNFYSHNAIDREDLIQNMWVKALEVWEKIKDDDNIKNKKGFINRCVRNKLMDILDRAHFVERHLVIKTEFSDPTITLEFEDDENTKSIPSIYEWESYESIELNDMLAKIELILNPTQLLILRARINGYTYKEIAQMYSYELNRISAETVYNKHLETQNIIKEFLIDEGINFFDNLRE